MRNGNGIPPRMGRAGVPLCWRLPEGSFVFRSGKWCWGRSCRLVALLLVFDEVEMEGGRVLVCEAPVVGNGIAGEPDDLVFAADDGHLIALGEGDFLVCENVL